ncbi:MAG: exodeoxyribonuclease VII small subunit [Eubacteriales bacterium]|nr:exodeoxyribonuclease VII small subunit [Eubacteriales bacterium]
MAKKNEQESMQEKSEMTLEEAFAELDGVLETLERRDITLEESFQTYQKGMELLKECNRKIDRVEKKMQVMNEEGDLDEFQ